MDKLTLETQGYALIQAVLSEQQCRDVEWALAGVDLNQGAGCRNLLLADWCSALAVGLRRQADLAGWLTERVAVQCTLFDKTPQANWLVSPHQDLSIPVRARVEHPELGGWSNKDGMWFVQPPAAVLEELVAVRVHIDANDESNGPLRVVPGSHRQGRLSQAQSRALREQRGEVVCVVPRGGAVVMKPLTLHASSKSVAGAARRVLHFLFGPKDLPFGLIWDRAR